MPGLLDLCLANREGCPKECQNVYFVKYIGRECFPIKFTFTIPLKREDRLGKRKEKTDRRAEKVKGGSGDERPKEGKDFKGDD